MHRLVLLTLCACGQASAAGGPPREVVAEVPAVENRNLDLLWVIDDSGNTAHLQTNLRAVLPLFFDRLSTPIDLHTGVITSDLGTASSDGGVGPPIGTLGQGGCAERGKQGNLITGQAAGLAEPFLSDIGLEDGTRQRNFDGELATVLGQMISVGSTGCGFEQPLAAMRAALDNNPVNAGFLRSDATLAVVFLMDEDDCSVRDPALFSEPDAPGNPLQSFRCTRFGVTCLDGGNTPDEMKEVGIKGRCGPNTSDTALLDDPAAIRDFLIDVKADPRRIVVGGMFGNPEPVAIELRTINGAGQPALAHSCTFAGPDDMPNTADDQVADPGVRLQAFADLFGDRSSTASICNNDLSVAVEGIADRIAFAMGSPCITQSLFDADPESEGLQPECIVEDLVGDSATLVPPCPEAPTCWTIAADAEACPLFDHLQVEITRDAPPDPATVTRVRCTIEYRRSEPSRYSSGAATSGNRHDGLACPMPGSDP